MPHLQHERLGEAEQADQLVGQFLLGLGLLAVGVREQRGVGEQQPLAFVVELAQRRLVEEFLAEAPSSGATRKASRN